MLMTKAILTPGCRPLPRRPSGEGLSCNRQEGRRGYRRTALQYGDRAVDDLRERSHEDRRAGRGHSLSRSSFSLRRLHRTSRKSSGQKLGHTESLVCEPWPVYDPAKIQSDSVEVVLQVNGKVRGKITMPVNAAESELQKAAMADENVRRHAEGKQVVKMIVVQNKLVNVVVR